FRCDRSGGTHLRAGRIFAMHADNRTGLRCRCAVHKFQVNHGLAAVCIAFHAGLDTCLASDAARLIDEELEVHILTACALSGLHSLRSCTLSPRGMRSPFTPEF